MWYYQIDRENLGKDAKIPLCKLDSSEQVFRRISQEMVDEITVHNARGEKTVFICPVGPVGQYPFFVEQVNRQHLSLKNVWFINMDEYLQQDGSYLPQTDKLSFRGFMESNVYSRIAPELVMSPAQRVFPNPQDPGAIERLIEELGGVDICFGGIGMNGHLAFNEAQPELTVEEFACLPTRVLAISPETRAANAIGDLGGALEDMPQKCVTIGFEAILKARKVRLGVFRNWHRAVVRRAVYGEKTAAFPVTLLQGHNDALIYVNDVAAERAY